MLFNSFSFLVFFTLLVIVYYALPHRYRWVLLLAASLYFYAAFNIGFVILLLGITVTVYVAGLALERVRGWRHTILAAGVAVPVAVLGSFKLRTELVVAAGLSFYTLSCISYLADVYAGRLRAERHFGRFALYVAFFPKLLAGPIERAKPFLAQVREPVWFNGERVSLGLQLMLWGLFKKVVIADRLALFVDAATASRRSHRRPTSSLPRTFSPSSCTATFRAIRISLKEVLARHRVAFHDFSLVGNEERFFSDTDHLNRAGVLHVFERYLARTLAPEVRHSPGIFPR